MNRLGPAPHTQKNPIDVDVIWMEPEVFIKPATGKHRHFLTSFPIGMLGLEAAWRKNTGQMHCLWQQTASLGQHLGASLGSGDSLCMLPRHHARPNQGATVQPLGQRSDALGIRPAKKP